MISIIVYVLMCGEFDAGCLRYKSVQRLDPIERCEVAAQFFNSEIHRSRFTGARPVHFAFCARVGLDENRIK